MADGAEPVALLATAPPWGGLHVLTAVLAIPTPVPAALALFHMQDVIPFPRGGD